MARRYALDANLIDKWLHDPRFALSDAEPEDDIEIADFLEVAVTAPDFPISANTDISTATGDLAAT